MFGAMMRATTSLITTTSSRLFGESTSHIKSAASNYAQAILDQAEAASNVISGVAKISATVITIGLGAATAGTLVGASITVNAALSALSFTASTLGAPAFVISSIGAVQGVLTSAGILSVMHPGKFVAGAGGVYTLLNGQMLIDGCKEVIHGVKKEGEAVLSLGRAAVDNVKAVGYGIAGTGLKVLEKLDAFVGSDQDGQGNGESTNLNIEKLNLGANDADLGQKLEKLFEDKDALKKATDVTNLAISELTGDNEITAAVKANQQIVLNTLAQQEDVLVANEDNLAEVQEMMASWYNLNENNDLTNPKINETVKIEFSPFVGQTSEEVAMIGDGEEWFDIDLTASSSAA